MFSDEIIAVLQLGRQDTHHPLQVISVRVLLLILVSLWIKSGRQANHACQSYKGLPL